MGESIRDQNLYDILEVGADATLQEIERAYRIAHATYQPNALATYSVFSDAQAGDILRRVDEAYAVLSDARMRREYDARLRREGVAETLPPALDPAVRESPPAAPPTASGWSRPQTRAPGPQLEDSLEPDDGIFDGPVLRRIRLSRGIELEEISSVTKISESYLRYIEENRYVELPPSVYVRGFLKEYARTLRLDARRVTDSYMRRYEEQSA